MKIEILTDQRGNEPVLPTMKVSPDTWHVVLIDYDRSIDVKLSSAEIGAILRYFSGIPAPEVGAGTAAYAAALRERLMVLKIPRKVAVGYAAARGYLDDLPKPAREQLAKYWKKFSAEAMQWHEEVMRHGGA
jgi:hypothetical protein